MPIPHPDKDENKQHFVARCMGDKVMKKDYKDTHQRIAVCLSQTQRSKSIIEDVKENLAIQRSPYDEEWDEFTPQVETDEFFDEDEMLMSSTASESRKVTLNKPHRTPDGPKKFSVYVKNDKGNVVKVNFGDPNMEIKRDDPERRKSYRARHNCDNPGPKWKANYWSCKMWSITNVSDLT